MSSAGTIDSRHGKEAWNKFVTTGECIPAVAPLIAQSWARCRALGHDPKRGPAAVVVEREELERRVARNRDLLAVAVPILDELQALVKDLGFLTLLTDSDGVPCNVDSDCLGNWSFGTVACCRHHCVDKDVSVQTCDDYCGRHPDKCTAPYPK